MSTKVVIFGNNISESFVALIAQQSGLEISLHKEQKAGNALTKKEWSHDIEPADVYIIAASTNVFDRSGAGHTDSLAPIIAKNLKSGDLVILAYPTRVGGTAQLRTALLNARPELGAIGGSGAVDVHIAYSPDLLLEKRYGEFPATVAELTVDTLSLASGFVQKFTSTTAKTVDLATAELFSFTQNAWEKNCLAFSNELHIHCDTHDVNFHELADIMKSYGIKIPAPSIGQWGEDLRHDENLAHQWYSVNFEGHKVSHIQSIDVFNKQMSSWVKYRINKALEDHPLKKPTICFFGLASKPDCANLVRSDALSAAKEFKTSYAGVSFATDPHVRSFQLEFEDVEIQLVSVEEAIKADILVFLVKHHAFGMLRDVDFSGKIVLDFVGALKSDFTS